MTVGRLGAVLGNIAFGFLIDIYCEYLFFGMSSILVGKYIKHPENMLTLEWYNYKLIRYRYTVGSFITKHLYIFYEWKKLFSLCILKTLTKAEGNIHRYNIAY